MNKIATMFFGLAILVSCNNAENKESEAKVEEKTEIKSENIQLANDIDPICQMPVKAHYEDTTLYQGKVYGFCNVACKEEFKKNPGQYVKE